MNTNISTDRLVSDFKAVARDTEELLKAGAGEAGKKAVAGAKAADKVVREHPYQSIGIAFGVGLLVGVLVTRK